MMGGELNQSRVSRTQCVAHMMIAVLAKHQTGGQLAAARVNGVLRRIVMMGHNPHHDPNHAQLDTVTMELVCVKQSRPRSTQPSTPSGTRASAPTGANGKDCFATTPVLQITPNFKED